MTDFALASLPGHGVNVRLRRARTDALETRKFWSGLAGKSRYLIKYTKYLELCSHKHWMKESLPASSTSRPRHTVRSVPLTEEDAAPARTLADDALERIRGLILTGELRPGDRLRLEELAARLRTSPMPVREAVRRLEQLGLVQHVPHRGATVTPISIEELVDLYAVRLVVEPLAVRNAAAGFTKDLFYEGLNLLQRLEAAERSGDKVATWEAHAAFHFLLYRASRSPWLLRTIEPLWERAQCYRTGYEAPLFEGRHRQHLDILTACNERDADLASRLMHNHLATMANRMAELIGGAGDPPFALQQP